MHWTTNPSLATSLSYYNDALNNPGPCISVMTDIMIIPCETYRGKGNYGLTGNRTQSLSLILEALCKMSYRAIWSDFHIPLPYLRLVRLVSNLFRTAAEDSTRHALLGACGPSSGTTLSTNCHSGGTNIGQTRTRSQSHSLTVQALYQLNYIALWSPFFTWNFDCLICTFTFSDMTCKSTEKWPQK